MTNSSWTPFQDYDFSLPDKKQPKLCKPAQEFLAWRDMVCTPAFTTNNVVLLNQTKLKLLDKYYHFYKTVSKEHQICVGQRSHRCIFHIFMETLVLLKEREGVIDPPLLFVPLPPPPPPQKKPFTGLTFGEVMEGYKAEDEPEDEL